MKKFESICHHCPAILVHDGDRIGEEVECPSCGKITTLLGEAPAKEPERSPPVFEDEAVRCPRCHSAQVSANKKGFKLGKAAAGGLVFVLVRGQHDRRLTHGRQLWESLKARSAGGRLQVKVPRSKTHPARVATLELRWMEVEVKPPARRRLFRPTVSSELRCWGILRDILAAIF